MKKLMIALGAVAVVAGVQAASIDWKMDECTALPGGSAYVKADSTVYLIQSSGAPAESKLNHTQDAFIQMIASTAFDSWASTLDSWSVAQTKTNDAWGDFEVYGGATTMSGDPAKAYYAIIDTASKSVFMSTEVDAIFSSLGQQSYTVNFGSDDYDASVLPLKTATAAGSEGAGWYTSAVPEPTSGLLLLLGVAGLALRRRRA